MSILTDEEILEIVLRGTSGFQGQGLRQYEFHIVILGADAHKMTAHILARAEKKKAQDIEDAKPKPKTFVSNFVSKYACT